MGKRAKKKLKAEGGHKEWKLLGLSKGVWMGLFLAFVMGGSMVGYVAMSIANPESATPTGYARVAISTQNKQVFDDIEIEEDYTALDALNEIGTVTVQELSWSVEPYTVEFANMTVTQNSTHAWFLYINGRYASKDIDKQEVLHGDVIELRFEPLP